MFLRDPTAALKGRELLDCAKALDTGRDNKRLVIGQWVSQGHLAKVLPAYSDMYLLFIHLFENAL